jgi:catechol 2,3-dioxygenase-like lactoylglutathione lyase family enzyme/GNAT superfamily N-acetyltransferase
MKFKRTTPILYSGDILQSLRYYTEILGFQSQWKWGEPPSFGGVNNQSVEIFFCLKGQGNPGTWVFLTVDDVDEFHDQFQARGAKILCPPENTTWGAREMLVEDPDGNKIRFVQFGLPKEKSIFKLPDNIKIVHRIPSSAEYQNLIVAVGWNTPIGFTESILSAPVFAVVAEDSNTGQAVGCGLILGDRASFYYIKDLMVHPSSQGQCIGTEMMKELVGWLERHAPAHSMAGLFTGENLGPFYNHFDFHPTFGMIRHFSGASQ